MSAVIKTLTPFIEKRFLLKALESIGISFSTQEDTILIKGVINVCFRKSSDGKFLLNHYGYNSEIIAKLPQIEERYTYFYKEHIRELEEKRLEAEKIKIENERKKYVEKQRQEIIKKAEAKGYKVKEKQNGSEIQLVLVKHTY